MRRNFIYNIPRAQDRKIGSVTSVHEELNAPTTTNYPQSFQTIQVPNVVEVPDLTLVPTDDTVGAFWTSCNQYRGSSTLATPPPDTPFIYGGSNSNATGTVKGYNLTSLSGFGNIPTNDVTRFDFHGIITREPTCDNTGNYNYFINLFAFSQPLSSQKAILYDTITDENATTWSFKNKPNVEYRLILESLSTNISGTPVAIADSSLIKSQNVYDPCSCGIKLKILSAALITGYVAKQQIPDTYVQYQSFLNIRSSIQCQTNTNLVFGNYISKYSQSSSNPYPYTTSQDADDPTITVCGDVLGQKIIFSIVPNTGESANKINAKYESYPKTLQFTYNTRFSGDNLMLDCSYYATGDEPDTFEADLAVYGIESTKCNTGNTQNQWVVSTNPIYLRNQIPSFATPVAISYVPYDPNNFNTRTISLLVSIKLNI